MDLFDTAGHQAGHEPLAARMRPRTLDEYIGQDAIVGPGRLLRRAIQADRLTSVIFYGPPGTGKTTLAQVIANHTKSSFITLNAVLSGVQQIRDAIKQAEEHRNMYQRKTILFVDEVHRWNRAQQDALLPWVENGTIILIGATTENPFFEVNKALVSRSRIFQLKPLETADLLHAADMAIHDTARGYGKWNITFEDGALEHLAETASGDARSMLNALELAIETTPDHWPPEEHSEIHITMQTAEESIQQKVVLYDRDGDYHYDVISAFIKSLRGRDPDAALYWLARMVSAGESPAFIFRRMLISASEDTGLADPHAISVVESCAAAFDRVGMPEGRFFLTQAALYLATCPKSNSAMAFFDAVAAVEKEDTEVPVHLCDGNRDAEGFGHGDGYMYPHAYRDHWVAQQYLPDTLTGRVFYTPSSQGYEATIRDDVLTRRELQIAAILADAQTDRDGYGYNRVPEYWQNLHNAQGAKSGEVLTFSPRDNRKEEWLSRLDATVARTLLFLRNTVMDSAAIKRNSRILIPGADDGLFLWESIRRAPEGCTAGLCTSQKGKDILEQYAATLGTLDRPVLAHSDYYLPGKLPPFFAAGTTPAESSAQDSPLAADQVFDRILCRDIFTAGSSLCPAEVPDGQSAEKTWDILVKTFAHNVAAILADGGMFVCAQRIPKNGQRLSSFLSGEQECAEAAAKMRQAEDTLFTDTSRLLFCIDSGNIAGALGDAGFGVEVRDISREEQRRITGKDIHAWFSPETAYGEALAGCCTPAEIDLLRTTLLRRAEKQTFPWLTATVLITAVKQTRRNSPVRK